MSISIRYNTMSANTARQLGAHYSGLARSVERISSGLRVNKSADDAAGLSIRELMRAEIAGLRQGIRNANDAISMIQTADGALGVIDEKLIRMKELAEQAATGTYNTEQRLMIDQEFQAMAAEINRIATATDFNGVKLLDGSLSGTHDGSGLESSGAVKAHFGTGNDSAEDYYYITIGDATIRGLGLTIAGDGRDYARLIIKTPPKGAPDIFPFIPMETGQLTLTIMNYDTWTSGIPANNIQVFTKDGVHIAGTTIQNGGSWEASGINNTTDLSNIMTVANGFNPGATYVDTYLNNGTQSDLPQDQYANFTYNGMAIQFRGESDTYTGVSYAHSFHVNAVTEDLIIMVTGQRTYTQLVELEFMPDRGFGAQPLAIETQEAAQRALPRIDEAVVRKDQIRAHIGALQNRLENTVSNLQIQAENTQAAESRISDADVAVEMTEFVRTQILAQAAIAMLAQTNYLPGNIAMDLISG